ncbi:MAG: Eco57I restriction-modification methylase domain-containing protein, partial [Candidatus Thorarchaeota archaeon]
KFNEITTNQSPYKNYFEFIIYFLRKIHFYIDTRSFDKKITGKIIIPGPLIIFNLKKNVKGVSIPNKCFYVEGFNDRIGNESSSKKDTKIFPMLNFFKKYAVNFNGFVLSCIYENFSKRLEKRFQGSYYTPETITSYISKFTIEAYLIDKMNLKFNSNFDNLNSIINSNEIMIKKYLIHQMQVLTILDPAVGTGHLLESSINGLLEVYERIRREFIKTAIIEGVEDENDGNLAAQLAILNVENYSFFILHNILSNNIYGVDIDSNVLKIAKARLLLLLIELFNGRPQEFPNVRLNLKEGNALLGYISAKKSRSTKQLNLDSYLLRNNCIIGSKSNGFDAQLPESLDHRFSQEYSIPLPELKKVRTFHWENEFPEIILRGGFNIILANPPYLGESGSKELFRIYAKALPNYYEGKIDLWYLFFQRSLDLMLPNAFSSFITSNYWITASGAQKLRFRICSDTFIVQYINFGENKVFNTAQGVHINLITFKKSRKANNNISCILFDTTYPLGTDLIQKLDEQDTFQIHQKYLIFKNWDTYIHFFSKEIRRIIEQIIKNSTLLKNSGFYVKEGIVTGLNNITRRQIKKYGLPDEWAGFGVFILNKDNPQDVNVIESFSCEEKIHLKNFYKNSDISRYYTSIHTKKSLLYLNRNTVNLDSLPRIKIHIQKFKNILHDSLDNPPYINRPRLQDIFISPKIVTPQRSLKNTFAYNSFDWYAAQDVYYILNDENNKEQLKSLLLILNSKLAYFWLYWMGKRKGNHLELFGEPLSYFPLANYLDDLSPLFSHISEYLLFLHSIKDKQEHIQQLITYFETEIADSLIYELYFSEASQKNSLSENLSRITKQIKFDEWEKFHYREKLGGGLSEDDKFQIDNLESQNTKIIERCYQLLLENKEIRDIISQIKIFDSVKRINF